MIDEAASEAWECMDNKPIDETNYEKSRNHAVRSNRVSGRNQLQHAYMGGSMAKKYVSVPGGERIPGPLANG